MNKFWEYVVGQGSLLLLVWLFGLQHFDNPQGWPLVIAYGSLLIMPLQASFKKDKLLFSCFVGCLFVWCCDKYLAIVDENYIGGVCTLYAALGAWCWLHDKKFLMWTSFAISAYGFLMVAIHGLTAVMNYWYYVGWNLVYLLQVIYAGFRIDHDQETSPLVHSALEEDERAAA